jgi:hypothetical protein
MASITTLTSPSAMASVTASVLPMGAAMASVTPRAVVSLSASALWWE